jgi:hypothetical protein
MPLPPPLVEEIAHLLAQAVLADMREHPELYPNLAQSREVAGAMGVPRRRTARRRRARGNA